MEISTFEIGAGCRSSPTDKMFYDALLLCLIRLVEFTTEDRIRRIRERKLPDYQFEVSRIG